MKIAFIELLSGMLVVFLIVGLIFLGGYYINLKKQISQNEYPTLTLEGCQKQNAILMDSIRQIQEEAGING